MLRCRILVPALLSVLALAAAAPAAAMEDLAPVLPADTMVYARMAGLDPLLADLASSRLLRDGEMLRGLYEEAVSKLLSGLGEITPVEEKTWKGILGSLGGVHVALFPMTGPIEDPTDLDALAALEVGKPDDVQKVLRVLLGGHAMLAGEVAGARVMSIPVGPDRSIYYALRKNLLLAATRAERITAVLQALEKAPETSLASGPGYRAGALRAPEGTTFFLFADLPQVFSFLPSTMSTYEAKDFREAFRILDLGKLKTACLVSGNGRSRLRVISDPTHRWLAASRGEPGPLSLASFASTRCMFLGVDSGSIPEKWAAVKKILTSSDANSDAEDVKQGLEEWTKTFGFSFDELAAVLGDEWALFLPMTKGARLDEDALTLAFEIKDRRKLAAILRKFLTSPAIQRENKGAGMRKFLHAGAEVWTLGAEGVRDAPALAVAGDVLLVSGRLEAVEDALDARSQGTGLLSASGPFLGDLPASGTKMVALAYYLILEGEREFVPLLDVVHEGAVLAGVMDEAPGRLDLDLNESLPAFLGTLLGGELLLDRYRNEQAEALSNLRAIGQALKRFREKNGDYPDSLLALVPDYLPRARLVDPLDRGREGVTVSYRYRKPRPGASSWGILAWSPHRLYGRLVLYIRGNAWPTSEHSFRRLLRQGR